jgi:hypothetical protein
MGFAIGLVQATRRVVLVLDGPVIIGAADHVGIGVVAAGLALVEQEHRADQLHLFLETEIASLGKRVELITAEIADHQNIGLRAAWMRGMKAEKSAWPMGWRTSSTFSMPNSSPARSKPRTISQPKA